MTSLSVITVTYNDAYGLAATMKSVAEQTQPDFQYIVQDGLSTDETASVVAGHRDVVDIYASESDSGIYNAMNRAVENAGGEFTLFLNAGDVFVDEHTVHKILGQLEDGIDIIYGLALSLESGRVHHYRPSNQFWAGMVFDHQATLVRTALIKTLRFDESLRIAGDLDFFSRARLKGCSIRQLHMNIAIKPYDVGASSDWFERFQERQAVLMRHFGEKYPVADQLRSELLEHAARQFSTDPDRVDARFPDTGDLLNWLKNMHAGEMAT